LLAIEILACAAGFLMRVRAGNTDSFSPPGEQTLHGRRIERTETGVPTRIQNPRSLWCVRLNAQETQAIGSESALQSLGGIFPDAGSHDSRVTCSSTSINYI